jgi:ABC-type glutathione transport system ATPase component
MAKVQPVFQNPFEAFNPLKRVDRYLFESTARRFLACVGGRPIEAAMDGALQKVGLSLPEVRRPLPARTVRGPAAARRAIARALIPNPALLDRRRAGVDGRRVAAHVDRQPAARAARRHRHVSVIYITHDLATAYYISDRMIIMQRGQVVETGDARTVLGNPQHPYSKLLKASVLSSDDAGRGKLLVDPDAVRLVQDLAGKSGRLVEQPDGRSILTYS